MDFLPTIPKEYTEYFQAIIVALYCIGASLIVINRRRFEQTQKYKPQNMKKEYAYPMYIVIGSIVVWSFGNLWTWYVFPMSEEEAKHTLWSVPTIVLKIYSYLMFGVALYHLGKEMKQKAENDKQEQ